MIIRIISIEKKEPENFSECSDTRCIECVFESEDCTERRAKWKREMARSANVICKAGNI